MQAQQCVRSGVQAHHETQRGAIKNPPVDDTSSLDSTAYSLSYCSLEIRLHFCVAGNTAKTLHGNQKVSRGWTGQPLLIYL